MRLVKTVEAHDAVVDRPCAVISLDLEQEDVGVATEHTTCICVLKRSPRATLVRLEGIKTEFLPPLPCSLHVSAHTERDCAHCDFRCLAVTPQLSHRAFNLGVSMSIPADAAQGRTANVKVQRKTSSGHHQNRQHFVKPTEHHT